METNRQCHTATANHSGDSSDLYMNESLVTNGELAQTGSGQLDKESSPRESPNRNSTQNESTSSQEDGSTNNVNKGDKQQKNNKVKRVIDCLSWNVEGLLEKINTDDFLEFLKKFDILILGETFTLPRFNFEIKFPEYFHEHSPAKKYNRFGRPSGGIVLLIRKELKKFCKILATNTSHVLAVRIDKSLLDRRKDIVLVATYIHPTGSVFYTDKDYNCTLEELEQFLVDYTDTNEDADIVVAGDLNARVGDWCLGGNSVPGEEENEDTTWNLDRTSQDTVINANGKTLIELCTTFNLSPVGGLKTKNFNDRVTFIGPGGSSQIDHFVATAEIIEDIIEYNNYNRIESKHLPISVKIGTKEESTQQEEQKRSLTKRKWQENRKEEVINILNKPSTIRLLEEAEASLDQDINLGVEKFTSVLTKANKPMETTLDLTMKNKFKQGWFDKQCLKKKKEVKKKLDSLTLLHPNTSQTKRNRLRKQYLDSKIDYHKLLREKRKKYNRDMKTQLKEDSKDSKKFWSTIKRISTKKTPQPDISKERWQTHFTQLLNPNSEQPQSSEHKTLEDEPIEDPDLDGEITREEVARSIKNLKKEKSTGMDNISAELLQTAGDRVIPFLTKLMNKLFQAGCFPLSWATAIVVPLYKKGDRDIEDNYRGISLLSIPSKILTSILNKRLYNWAEENGKISTEQAGFRRSYSTVDHIYTLYSMASNCLYGRKRSKLYVAFIDYRKAFDTVDRNILFKILEKQGVSTKFLNMLKAVYKVVNVVIRCGEEFTNTIYCPLGVKQGCLLSPLLFSLLITEVARKVAEMGRAGYQFIPGTSPIYSLLFADDIVLISTTPAGLQNQLNSLKRASDEIGLTVNLDKTKVMTFRKGGFLGRSEKWYFGRTRLEVVNSYKYLGFTMTTKLSTEIALAEYAGRAKNRIISIFRALYKLGPIDVNLFFKLFDTQVKPILLYAAEVWGNRQVEGREKLHVIERVHMYACKRLLGVSMKTPNAFIYAELNRFPLTIDSVMRSIKYWAKLLQLPQERIPRQAYEREKAEMNKVNGWGHNLKKQLEENGYGNVWLSEGVNNFNTFCRAFRQTLVDQFWQNQHAKLTSKARFTLYNSFKEDHNRENYLDNITITRFRKTLTRARFGVVDIKANAIYSNPEANTTCPFCAEEETMYHLLLKCPTYNGIRNKYLERRWITLNNIKVEELLGSQHQEIQQSAASFLFYALQLRDNLI